MTKSKTDFGFKQIDSDKKQQLVKGVFDSVAKNYDLMNDLMSFGLHRIWKKFLLLDNPLRGNEKILDLAGGSGDLSILFKEKNKNVQIIHSDINEEMLKEGKKKIIDKGLLIPSVTINAENIPFSNNYFDIVTISFGLRNMTHKNKVLNEIYRCLKPGGKIVILEFSKVHSSIKKVYDFFSFNIIPKIGQIVANDSNSYQYLAESIRMHPEQEKLLKMLEDEKFENCSYKNLTGGIVAIHSGYKI
jgi:demethylmenaquinone methyltransferase / 2-methoxy-6-polyprenyl-1,4-benzoquinol methylase